MKESPLKYRYFTFLYGFVLIVLLIPFLQSQFMLHREEALKGSFVYAQDVSGKWKTWHDASFQTGKENYLKENFGFRNTLVRLNNQIFYSFFKINRISGVVIGKEDYLYGSDYIFSYLGYNFIGEDSLRNTAIKLKRISDELDRRGKKLIVAIAPGTASLKQQFLPEKYDTVIRGKTNYDYFVKYANENQLNLIDFQAFFKIAMDTASYPMLPKYGTHWSSYGSYLSLDSLLRYISARTNVDLPKLILDSLEVVHEYRGAD
ncbi:MAG TPA: hypothetical protein PKM16_11575, partial [Bacteroidia bacterium]|nr:hypothetical protein [Bacteroidia bacterium]